MKTITSLLLTLALFIMVSCEGPMGPPGIDGVDGDNLLGTIIEIEGDFTPQNNYNLYYSFPSSLKVYDGDVVLVYILWEQVQANNGQLVDVWRLLPQTVILNDGILQYNFDHTTADVQIFLEGTTNFNNLLPAETQDQVFRIAILPAAFLKSAILDYKDYDAVMKSMNLDSASIIKDSPTTERF